MSKITNRPEIDGLRAVAVTTVVLYHTALGFPGGYVGVDVFFVISGYLITSLILTDLRAGAFRIVDFWERRARRILPALGLVVLASVVTAWFMFIPSDFKELGRSVIYQSLLISNVFYWKTIGYFGSTDTQPLLHTWSLAVEEQFYVIFPFLLIALGRFKSAALVRILFGIAVCSLGFSILATYSHPYLAFYLLPSRAWELLLGSLLAAWPETRRPARWLNECLSWIGILGVIAATLHYGKDTRFPGAAALLPCVGTGLVIWTNSPSRTSVGRMLSWPPWVFVGLVSYSFYLWHWPVLIFSKYWAADELSVRCSLAVIAASFLLATITWKVVETPFRKRVVLPGRSRIFAFSGFVLVALFVVGFRINHANGFRSRWRPEALRYIDAKDEQDFRVELELESAERGELTKIGYRGADRPIDLLVWGDSHAMAVLHVLDAVLTRQGMRGVAATHSATAPLVDYPFISRYWVKEESIPYNWAVANFARKNRIKNVLLVAAWSGYVPPTATQLVRNQFEASLTKTVDILLKAGVRVFIMKDVPKQRFDVPRILGVAAERGQDPARFGLSMTDHVDRTGRVNAFLDTLAGPSVVLIDPIPTLIDKAGRCPASLNGRALYFDQHHLTIYGEMQLQPLFERFFPGDLRAPAER